jgi:hypothetical protein
MIAINKTNRCCDNPSTTITFEAENPAESAWMMSLYLGDSLIVTDVCEETFVVGDIVLTPKGSKGTVLGYFCKDYVRVNVGNFTYLIDEDDLELCTECEDVPELPTYFLGIDMRIDNENVCKEMADRIMKLCRHD